ncbi:MAG TPA: hypothetical protein VMY76_07185 [Gemmatimonadales bacterium]|nr:hypothetical protein [Gemmatimonadales bacterium]
MNRRRTGLLLAAIHVAMVGSLGLKLLADRTRLPRAWTRTAPYDPSTPLRGRYVSLSLEVPLTGAPLDTAAYAESGVRLRADNGSLVGELDAAVSTPRVRMREIGGVPTPQLAEPVAFFIPEHVPDPSRRAAGEELWAEVTIPRSGPPRPIRLGVKKGGKLLPLELR